PPGGQDCSPLVADCSWGFDPPSCFYSRVVAAIGATQAAHPDWFSRNDEYSCDAIAVGLDDDYMAEVVQRLNGAGLCARVDTGDEIAVKLNGTYSEQFDIIADPAMRTGPPPRCVRSGGGSYMGRNVPACF
ncbi:MAG: hypothetical protein K8H88_22065, partial [Sandaracinaceae bacterium]|nr:hypothetical protein [Sandaracinaceae bacterium]